MHPASEWPIKADITAELTTDFGIFEKKKSTLLNAQPLRRNFLPNSAVSAFKITSQTRYTTASTERPYWGVEKSPIYAGRIYHLNGS